MERWSCGPAAIVNAVVPLGLVIEERSLHKFADPKVGMDEKRMLTALRSLHLPASEYMSLHDELAWKALLNELPAILCVDNEQHWIAATRVVAEDHVEVRDPAIGTRVYDIEALTRRWRHRGYYYFISLRGIRP